MPDYDGSVRIGVEIDTDPATKELSQFAGEAEKSVSAANKIGSALKTGMAVAATAIGAATTAIGAFAKSAVDVGMNFDSSMSQVAATMGKTTDEISDLREFALEMGATTAFSATEAADALNFMALAGYDAEESMQALPNVLNLAAAGGIDLAAASDMVTDAQSALGLTMDESAELVDKMAMASSKSNTSVAQLGEAILTVGGTAKNLAGGTTELSTALGILADNGIKGAEGGTALRNIILSLSAPTDTAAKAMERLGLQVFDAEGNMRPLNETFADLDAALSSMTQGEQTQVLSEIFNKVDLKSVNALLSNTGERFDELSGYIDNAAGAAEKMANTQLDNLAGDVTLFQSALEGAQIVLSDQLTPKLREFTQFGTEAITKLSEAFQEGGLTGAMDALGEILSEGLAMVIEQLPAMVDAGAQLLGAIGEGLLDNLGTITSAAMEIVQNLAQGLADALPKLIPAATEAVLKFAESLTSPASLDGLIKAALGIITGLVEGLAKAVPKLIEYAPKIIANLVAGLIGAIPQLIDAGIQLVKGLGEGLIQGLLSLPKAIGEVAGGVVDGFKKLFGIHSPSKVFAEMGGDLIAGLDSGISDNWKSITDFFSTKPKEIAVSLSKTWDDISSATSDKWGNIKESLGKTWEDVLDAAGDKFSQVEDKVGDAWENIKKDTPERWLEITNIISAKWADIVSNAINWGKDLCKSLSDGIRAGISWVTNAAKGVASAVSGFLHFSEPDVGPLSDFHTYMPDMLKLMAKGIRENEHLAVDAVSSVADSMANAFSSRQMTMNIPDISTYRLPRVAQGSIIPVNTQFEKVMTAASSSAAGGATVNPSDLSAVLSALGDIRSAVREGKVLAVDGATFGKLVYDRYNAESGRVGTHLVQARG